MIHCDFKPVGTPTINPIVILTYLAEAAGAILLAAIFRRFYRLYRRAYLLHWTWSWWALSVYLLGAAAALNWASAGAPLAAARIAGSCVSLAAAYPQVAWLLFGTFELTTGRRVPRRLAQSLPWGLAAFGLATSLLFAWDPGAGMLRLFVQVGVRSLVAGLAFISAGLAVWRFQVRQAGLGQRLVGGAFSLYGLELIHIFLLSGWQTYSGRPVAYAGYLGLVDFLAQFVIGLGMVAWFFEEERKRATRASEQIQHLAYHDSLTGLPNRRLLLDRLTQSIAQAGRDQEKVAVLFLDLDRFKVINDSLGHGSGDDLLRAVATRLQTSMRKGDTVARLGGDEFTLVFPGLKRTADALVIAENLLESIRLPIFVYNRELYITTSIGICIYPDDGPDAETLLKNADLAMYRAKDQGRNNYQLSTPAISEQAMEQLTLQNDLRKALVGSELVVFYQPIVDLRARRIAGVEALVRWQHPQRGFLLPGDFLRSAENLGLLDQLDHWVLAAACAQVRKWQQRFYPQLRLAVNLSARHFQRSDLLPHLHEVLTKLDYDPRSLEVEITESIAMQNAEASLSTLRQLKELGVRVCIDDFGTGYSSLSYLRHFQIDKIKLDRYFVRDLPSDRTAAAIAAAVLSLARSLRIDVVAEGVEREEQRQFFENRGCYQLQGQLFHPALPASACEELFEQELKQRAAVPRGVAQTRSAGVQSHK